MWTDCPRCRGRERPYYWRLTSSCLSCEPACSPVTRPLSCPHDPEAADADALPAGKTNAGMAGRVSAWRQSTLTLTLSSSSVSSRWAPMPKQFRYLGRLIGGRLTRIETETIVPLATMRLACGRGPRAAARVWGRGGWSPWRDGGPLAGAYCYSRPGHRQPMDLQLPHTIAPFCLVIVAASLMSLFVRPRDPRCLVWGSRGCVLYKYVWPVSVLVGGSSFKESCASPPYFKAYTPLPPSSLRFIPLECISSINLSV